MTRVLKTLLVLLLSSLVVLLPQEALAHDALVSTDPEDGAVVEAPEQLTLTFSGEIAQVGATVVATDADGESVATGDPQVQGVSVVQPLASDLPAGDYEVVWRVTSHDGHPISGAFDFTVTGGAPTGKATGDTTGTEEATDESPTKEPTKESTVEETTPAQDTTDASAQGSSAGGVPAWAWLVLGLAVAGLLAALGVLWSRTRR